MSGPEPYSEAERVLTICNACRYCEGHCAVFPAMERRLTFGKSDIDYLANLCHHCGSCFHHCQYAPPHEFEVNVPAVFQEIREQNIEQTIWPPVARVALSRNLLWTVTLLAVLSVAFTVTALWMSGAEKFFSPPDEGFYEIIDHRTMVVLFGGVGMLVVASLLISAIRYWRDIGLPAPSKIGLKTLGSGFIAALTLRNLEGGAGEGCTWPTEEPSTSRRGFHHLVFYGFVLCFAATVTGTIYHYGFGLIAPYPLSSLPKIFGTLGGIGILAGVTGLAWLRRRSAASMEDRRGLAASLLFLLMMTSVTGLLLMLLRETSWLGLMLCLHLASVLALFVGMVCGKFTHGLYRLIALIRCEYECRKSE